MGGDDQLLTWCTAMARLNGVTASAIAAGLAPLGIDLAPRLAAFENWESRPGTRHPATALAGEARSILEELALPHP